MTVRDYDVVALGVPIAYNGFGDHDLNGRLYTLAEDAGELRAVAASWPEPFPDYTKEPERVPQPHPLARPLVLRACRGDELRVRLHNELDQPVGITVQGVEYDVRETDGLKVGTNPATATRPGQTREYSWRCEHEGVFHFGDMNDARGEGTQSHGLNGVLVVEPAGSTWTDPVDGGELRSGTAADVHAPGRSFREFVVVMMEYPDNDNPASPDAGMGMGMGGTAPATGPLSTPPRSGVAHPEHRGGGDSVGELQPASNPMLPVNLRIEPLSWREYRYRTMLADGELDPVRDAQTGEELHHSSWMFGDPATPTFLAYHGDPTVIRLAHGGMRDTHVFHTHLHQWHTDPADDRSPIIDSVSISPQQGLTLDLIGGAGSVQAARGDSVWHCHLYPHFHMGMWGLLRMFDTLQDGTGRYPDGTVITRLRPLPDREPPPVPTPERPGFPGFVAGSATFPQKAPRPPRVPGLPPGTGREPTALEERAFCPDPRPGAAFTTIGPPDAPVRRYHLVVSSGVVVHVGDAADPSSPVWHDHRGTFYALADEVDRAGGIDVFRAQLADGRRRLEPLVIRAAKGEVLEVTLTNALPSGPQAGTPFDPALPFQPECGLHTHLVKYDPLVSDGACIGWNYLSATTTPDQGADAHERYRSWVYRWYVDEDFGTTLFHDHLLPNYRQRHGLYGALIAEPAGATWHDPHDPARELPRGTQAVVRTPDGAEYRELVLAVAEFVPLEAHPHGSATHGAASASGPAGHDMSGHDMSGHDDGGPPGTSGWINPPPTPGAMTEQGVTAVNYRCEPLVLRPGDPADQFASDVHGDPRTPLLRAYPGERIRLRLLDGAFDKQHAFTVNGGRWREWLNRDDTPWRSEQTLGIATTADLEMEPQRSAGDLLWSFSTADDLWLGAWGLIRVHPHPVPDLPAIAGATGAAAPAPLPDAPDDPGDHPVRRYTVRAVAGTIDYSRRRTDPFGLRYVVEGQDGDEPLVLRCRAGEWVEVTLVNELDGPPPPGEFDPPLLALDTPATRTISGRVSLHPAGLVFSAAGDDGSRTGTNPDTTVPPGGKRTYRWFADDPGPVLLRDWADVVTHARRGLVGALVVEEADATPYRPGTEEPAWTGARAVVRRDGGPDVHELVLIAQDGLRQFHDGDLTQPVRDLPSDSRDDAGQKAFNYRSAHLHPLDPVFRANPPTPSLSARPGDEVVLHVVQAGTRQRNHCVSVHGQVWDVSERGRGPYVSTIGALGSAAARTIRFRPRTPGDHLYRTSNLHWGLSEGWWGLVRVEEEP